MEELNAFPKIFKNSDNPQDLFGRVMEVTEKIDGSQLVFGKVGGKLLYRSKGRMIYKESIENMFKPAIEYIESIEEKIPDNTVFYCEYLKSPKHNVLAYDRIPKNHLMIFGVEVQGKFVSKHDTLVGYAELLNIEAVPLIYKGKVKDQKQLEAFLDRDSVLGGVKAEGVVAKAYAPYMYRNFIFPIGSFKLVSERFKEVKSEVRKNKSVVWDEYKETYRTQSRWEKALIHLKEKGVVEGTTSDIGKLIKEARDDITSEEKENIKDYLWGIYGEELLRHSAKGLAEWYICLLNEENI